MVGCTKASLDAQDYDPSNITTLPDTLELPLKSLIHFLRHMSKSAAVVVALKFPEKDINSFDDYDVSRRDKDVLMHILFGQVPLLFQSPIMFGSTNDSKQTTTS